MTLSRVQWSVLGLGAAILLASQYVGTSAHAQPAYLDNVRVHRGGRQRRLKEMARFHPELARELTKQDRVHTYAGFHIADLREAA